MREISITYNKHRQSEILDAALRLKLSFCYCGRYASLKKVKGGALRKVLFKITAGTGALAALFLCLLGPLYLFRVYHGIDLNAQGPDGEIWFLIVGGGIGAGLARFVHWWLYCSIGGYSEQQENEAWGRKY